MLDTAPNGLGWQIQEDNHYFEQIDTHMPRLELTKRVKQRERLAEWLRDDVCRKYDSDQDRLAMKLEEEVRKLPCEASQEVRAFYCGEDYTLDPGEQVLLPAEWVRERSDDLPPTILAVPSVRDSSALVVHPLVCSSEDLGVRLLVENVSRKEVTVI